MNRLTAILASRNRTLKLWELVLFCIAAGFLTTLLHGYEYATSDQLEQIPLIMRKMDASYITNDYFVSAMSAMSPRIYYVKLMAWLGQFASLSTLFFWLTCLQHMGVGVVTLCASRRLFPSGDLAPIFSTSFVLGVAGPYLGGASHLYIEYLLPKSLVLFLVLWAAWEGINLRLLRCALISAVASIIHPQVAMLGAIVGFGTAGTVLMSGWGGDAAHQQPFVRRWSGFAVGGILLACVYFFLWLLPMRGGELSMNSLKYLTHFRAPHHHIPSSFALVQYLLALAFGLASYVMWKWWLHDESTNRELFTRLGMAGGIVLLLLLGGWFLVEVVPTRFFMSLQAYRTIFFIKWFGLMLLGGTVAGLLLRKDEDASPTGNWFYLSAIGMAQPALMLLGTIVESLRRKMKSKSYLLVFGVAILIQFAALAKFRGVRELLALYAILVCGVLLLSLRSQIQRVLIASGVCVAALLLVLIYHNDVQAGSLNRYVQSYVNGVTPKEERKFDQAVERVSAFVRQNTQPNALFLAPPDFGKFRIEARRALVVDFKTFPFYERDIIEWRDRMNACYGPTDKMGWEGMKEMDENYRRINDEKLLKLSNRYNAPFAVLYKETGTAYSILYEDEDYKVVAIH